MRFDERAWREAAGDYARELGRSGKRRVSVSAGRARWAAVAACGLLLAASPFAVAGSDGSGDSDPRADAAATGDPIREGRRNPRRGAASQETQIIANNSTYGTRQSNLSSNGGGAIYGCRSGPGGTPANNRPCIRANNLRDGLAFEFNTNTGNVGGVISKANLNGVHADSVPFVTNMSGMVENLNAHRVGGFTAAELPTDGSVRAAKMGPITKRAATVTVANNARGTANVSCQAGEVLLTGGGGFLGGELVNTFVSFSGSVVANAWRVHGQNGSGAARNLEAQVHCLQV